MQPPSIPGLPRPKSRVGFGCIRLNRGDAASFATIEAYLERGGNLFDTAEIYGRGESEQTLGAFFRSRGGRGDVLLVTKGAVHAELVRPDYIRAAIAGSLERLQMDRIDLYLLHRDDPSVPVGELVDVLNEAVNQGRIRAFGGSNWTVPRLEAANRYANEHGLAGFVASSPHLALAVPREPWWPDCTVATPEDVAWYRAQAMPVLAWSTQCRGFFAREPIEDVTHATHLSRVYGSEQNLERRGRLHELAERRGVSPSQLAVAYVLSLDLPVIALVGPRTVEEVSALMAAEQLRLQPAELAWLESGGVRAEA